MSSAYLLRLLAVVGLAAAQLQLTILHNNDIHSHFDPVAASTAACRDPNDPAKPCYGGIGRLVHAVNTFKEQVPNTLMLYGGDIFQGHLYYTLFRWQVVVEMINMVPYDAMALGNHEFDDGLRGLTPYLENVAHQQLCTNIDFGPRATPVTDKCLSSVVREIDGRKVGIMGYTTTETPASSNVPSGVTFEDEVRALSAEARRLKDQGVDIIIATGHSGYRREKKMAELIEDIDLVIGGHSHSLLYTGSAPDGDPVAGAYPTVVRQASGRTVLVVQAFQYGKYLGMLNVTFDGAGEVSAWAGNPVRLDGEKDQTAEGVLQRYSKQVRELEQRVIGTTLVHLVGDRDACRTEECNLGNLVADGSLRALLTPAEGRWSEVSAAIVNGGGIRQSVEPGDITLADVMQIQPFGNTMNVVTLSGATLREVFEHSVSGIADGTGRFLQVSGIRVTYNLDYPAGGQVRRLEIVCTKCLVPRLEPVQDDEEYSIVMPKFISKGGDGFDVIRDNKIAELNAGMLDVDLLQGEIERLTPISTGIEDRIVFERNGTSECEKDKHPCHGPSDTGHSHIHHDNNHRQENHGNDHSHGHHGNDHSQENHGNDHSHGHHGNANSQENHGNDRNREHHGSDPLYSSHLHGLHGFQSMGYFNPSHLRGSFDRSGSRKRRPHHHSPSGSDGVDKTSSQYAVNRPSYKSSYAHPLGSRGQGYQRKTAKF